MPARDDDTAPLRLPSGESVHAGAEGIDLVEFGFTAHRGAQAGQALLHTRQQGGAGVAESQGAGQPQEQRRAQLALQLVDVAPQRRLGEAPEPRRAREAAGLQHRVQALQKIPVERSRHTPMNTCSAFNGNSVEIRLTIQPTGNYSNTQYFIRYFQFDGQGTLHYYDEPPYLPNDLYPLRAKQFRLYYTSNSTVSQSFEVWISDNFGNEKQLSFEFNSSD